MKSKELTHSQSRHLEDLRFWVQDRFGKYTKFYQYQEAFNNHFQGYQPDMKLKLDLDSIHSGLISCAIAALVTGIWWESHREHQAEFFMMKVPGKSDNLHKRHVYLALPTINILSDSHFLSVINDTVYTHSPQVVDYILEDKYAEQGRFLLVETPIDRRPKKIRRLTGVHNFAVERYNLFNFHPQYPSPPAEPSSSLSTHSAPIAQPQK